MQRKHSDQILSFPRRVIALSLAKEMNPNVIAAAEDFISRAYKAGETGRTADNEELQTLQEKLGTIVPAWYSELIRSHPLIGIEFLWQAFEPEADYDGTLWCGWNSPKDTLSETLDLYPGVEVHEEGYFSVFSDISGGGDPYFMSASLSDNPEILQICHEHLKDVQRVIRGFSVISAGASLSEFLMSATFEDANG